MSVIADLIAANVDMSFAYQDRSNTLAAFRKQNATSERVNSLTDLAETEFGSLNKWKVARSQFDPDAIGRKRYKPGNRYPEVQSWLDHPVFYRTYGSTAAAIISQPYGNIDQYRPELDAIVQRTGLKWQTPPNERASFWYPGKTLFIILTKPKNSIIWFTEQQENPPEVVAIGEREG